MPKNLMETIQRNTALVAASQGSGGVVGDWFSMKNYRKAMFVCSCGALANNQSSVWQVRQATSRAGAGAKNVTNATVTISDTAADEVSDALEATITLATFTAGGVVTINGRAFTAHATVTDEDAHQFSIAGTDTQDAAELVTVISHCAANHNHGLKHVIATSALGVVTLTVDEDSPSISGLAQNNRALTVVGVATIGQVAAARGQAVIEIDADMLDHENGFHYIAILVTNTANTLCSAELIRGDSRYAVPTVGPSKYGVSA